MGLKDKLIQKLWGVLQGLITKYSAFIRKPLSMIALEAAANVLLDKLLSYLKDFIKQNIVAFIQSGLSALMAKIFTDPNNITDDQINEYVKRDPDLQKILQYAGNNLNESIVGDITLACTDPDYYDRLRDNMAGTLGLPDQQLNGEDFINIANQTSDFDEKISKFNSNDLNKLASKIKGVLPYVFLVYVLVLKVKEFLSQNEYPSKYRGKHLARLIRIVGAMLQSAYQTNKAVIENTITNTKESVNASVDSSKDIIKGLIASLKTLDGAISAILLAGLIYEFNRRLLQDKAQEELNSITSSILCPPEGISMSITGDSNTTRSLTDFSLKGFSCPIPLDNYITPHEPIEQKTQSFTCPLPQDTFASTVLGPVAPLSPLATKALYSNIGVRTHFYPLPKPGDTVLPGTPLFTDRKDTIIFSEVGGKITSINEQDQEIIISDIYEPAVSPLQDTIDNLGNNMAELTNTKMFLKDWYIHTILPRILAISPKADPSTAAEGTPIVYRTGGAEKRYEKAEKKQERIQKTYDKDARKVTGKDKVKENAENETLYKIKEDLERVEQVFYGSLHTQGIAAINQGKVTSTDNKEYVLIEWYMQIYQELLNAHSQSTTEEYQSVTAPEDKVQNKILTDFTKGINDILIQRYYIDGYKWELLTKKINQLSYELDRNMSKTEGDSRSYYQILEEKWVRNPQKGAELIFSQIQAWGKKVQSTSTVDKNKLRSRIDALFTFSQSIALLNVNDWSTEETPIEATVREANYMANYMGVLWRNLTEIPKKIDENIVTLDEIGRSSIVPSVITRDDEQYKWYCVGDSRECPVPEVPDERLSPFSKYEFKDIQYWLKYCAYATLSSVLSLPPNWGTGIPPPFGPIPLPTVYIPIKAFQLAWGALVIGITITGIYPFPWVMIANLSNEHHVPLVDPATILTKQADVIKKGLLSKLRNFKREMLQSAMDDVKEDMVFYNVELDRIATSQATLRSNRPQRNREAEAFGDKAAALAGYTQELTSWNVTRAAYAEEKVVIKSKLYTAQVKWDMLKSAQDGSGKVDATDPQLVAVEASEKAIDKSFAALDKVIAAIDPFIAKIPVATKPGTANFAFTLKNPKPIQKMADGVNEQVNSPLLEKISKPFDLDKEDLMSTNYGSKIDQSYINGKKYMNTLAASSVALIPVDPFPKYEMLVPQNLSWTLKFLLPSWGPTGGGQYGFPGFPKIPLPV